MRAAGVGVFTQPRPICDMRTFELLRGKQTIEPHF
jgi:hypothetical protein